MYLYIDCWLLLVLVFAILNTFTMKCTSGRKSVCIDIDNSHCLSPFPSLLFHVQLVYLLLAPVIPPSHFVVHKAFNTLYQFWIHTEVT